jgi:methionyl-tRNA synthetase
MPKSAAEILRRVGESKDASQVRLDDAAWRNEGERAIVKGDALWPRFEDIRRPDLQVGHKTRRPDLEVGRAGRSTTLDEQNPAAPPAVPVAPAAEAEKITIDDFMKVELRVAKVLAAEKVPNSRKLIKLNIDVGTEQRTLVAGIAEAYEPEQLVGRTIVMVFNLKPAKLMGIESNGMVLAASPDGGKPTLVTFDAEVPPGTRVR